MTIPVFYTTHPSPLGSLLLLSDGEALTRLAFDAEPAPAWQRDDAWFADARVQLDAYFVGDRTAFDLPLRPEGTPFQQRVWAEVQMIPYGRTTTYGDLAERLGDPKTVRAVGLANGRNPIAILIPCHRVVGADGALTGYAGGLGRKRALLALEQGSGTQGRLFE